MNTHYRKDQGHKGEQIAQDYYEKQGFRTIEKNRTIPGGEIDLIVTNDTDMVFVEVKMVNYVQDLHNYITPRKLQTLKRSIQKYLYKYPTDKNSRLDVVFTRGNTIVETFQHVEI